MTKRKDHFSWKAGDVEIKKDRSGHLVWSGKDIEIVKAGKTKSFKKFFKEEAKPEWSREGEKFDKPKYQNHDGWTDHSENQKEADEVKHSLNHADEHFGKIHKDLPAHHKNSISEYKEDSRVFNKHLRPNRGLGYIKTDQDKYIHGHVKHLDHVTSHRTSHDMKVYRGINIGKHESDYKNLTPGDTVKDHGYTGASFHKHVASEFSSDHVGEDSEGKTRISRPVVCIHVPKGSKGHFLDNHNASHSHKREHEFLLHRGTTFKVLGHRYDHSSKNHYIDMVVHHQEDHEKDHKS